MRERGRPAGVRGEGVDGERRGGGAGVVREVGRCEGDEEKGGGRGGCCVEGSRRGEAHFVMYTWLF